jgi:hypothetical protein
LTYCSARMAMIERDELKQLMQNGPKILGESENYFSGLRIGVRATTASLADYHEWNLNEIHGSGVVTDGACS